MIRTLLSCVNYNTKWNMNKYDKGKLTHHFGTLVWDSTNSQCIYQTPPGPQRMELQHWVGYGIMAYYLQYTHILVSEMAITDAVLKGHFLLYSCDIMFHNAHSRKINITDDNGRISTCITLAASKITLTVYLSSSIGLQWLDNITQ